MPILNRPLLRLERKQFLRLNNADDRAEHDALATQLRQANHMVVTEYTFPLSKLLPSSPTRSGAGQNGESMESGPALTMWSTTAGHANAWPCCPA